MYNDPRRISTIEFVDLIIPRLLRNDDVRRTKVRKTLRQYFQMKYTPVRNRFH